MCRSLDNLSDHCFNNLLSGQLWSASADRNPTSLNLNFLVNLECIWSLYPKWHHSIPESKCQTRELSTHLYPWNWSLSNFFLDALQIPSEWHQFYQITFLSTLPRAVVFLSLASSQYFFLLFFFFNSNHGNNVKESYTSQNWQENTIIQTCTRDTLTTHISEFRLSTMSTSHTFQIVLGWNIAVYSLQAMVWSTLVFLLLPCFDFISAKIYPIVTAQRTVVSLYYCLFYPLLFSFATCVPSVEYIVFTFILYSMKGPCTQQAFRKDWLYYYFPGSIMLWTLRNLTILQILEKVSLNWAMSEL